MTPEQQFVFTLATGSAVVTDHGVIRASAPEFLSNVYVGPNRTYAQYCEEWDVLGWRAVCWMDKQWTEPVAEWLPALFSLSGKR